MTIDPYSPCPGGTGKKIKFCCADLVGELDKIQRMIDGDQRTACAEYVNKLEAKYPGRACLLSIRGLLESSLENHVAAAATAAAFLEKYPDNPVALAESATVQAAGGNPFQAIIALEQAIDACGEEMHTQVYEAIGLVARALLDAGQILPARGLLMLKLGISQGEDQQTLSLLMAIERAAEVPLLFKENHDLLPPPADAPWRFEFDVAYKRALRGSWHVAAQKFTALAPLAANSPPLWHNLAILRGKLGDYDGAVAALRKFAALDVPLDDAVEAEALAQLLAEPPSTGFSETFKLILAVTNLEELEVRLSADGQAERMAIDPRTWTEAEEVPPRSVFALLDRPIPETGAGLTVEQVPQQLAEVFLYGKQTQREAQIELIVNQADREAAQTLLARLGGDAIGSLVSEEVIERVSPVEAALTWRWRLPADTSIDDRRRLFAENQRTSLLDRWPKIQQPLLDGRSMAEAAADPKLKIRILGHILLMELSDASEAMADVFNIVRSRLGLPTAGPIDPTAADPVHLPGPRLARIEAEKLTDDQLVALYRRAAIPGLTRALRKFATEIARRPSFDNQPRRAEAFGILSRLAEKSDDALKFVEEARIAAQKSRQSTAQWDLEELALRLTRREPQEVTRLFKHIREQHIKEPGVSEAFYQILAEFGLIGPDGRLIAAPQAEPSALVVPGGAEPGKLWTPDSQTAGSGEKQALWIPGAE